MQLHMQLRLPRDARYVTVMRRVAGSLLAEVDAPAEAVHDLQVAITEACGNVVRHANGVDDYSVHLAVDAEGCEVEVVDLGPGFVGAGAPVTGEDEDGRGLALIGALVDELEFVREEEAMRVRLVKRWRELALDEGSARAPRS